MWETAVLATLPIFFETYKRIMGERKCHISSDPLRHHLTETHNELGSGEER
jgi:hypothetical protein